MNPELLSLWSQMNETRFSMYLRGIKFREFAIFDHFREILYPQKVSKS